jgi:5'-3' exonuclease
MGIPAYFSYIIKNHVRVLLNLKQIQQKIQFDRLYMDCNSIVYDVYHEIIKSNSDPSFDDIIDQVVVAIQSIIDNIRPLKQVFIAFDGVAPFAKMNQQKVRRMRTTMMETADAPKQFYTFMITPGTRFMNRLSQRLNDYGKTIQATGKYDVIVSTSLDRGEGEHKIMEHMRTYANGQENVAVYGLDSDLIMLSIYHKRFFNNIYVFREAPEFLKSRIPIEFTHPKEPYFIDIFSFMKSIAHEMNGGYVASIDNTMQTVYDYVFLCFLLGNDFLPHFPSVNLRTTGIQTLLDVYYQLPNNYKRIVVIDQEPRIWWEAFGVFIKNISKVEHERWVQEHELREKHSRRYFQEVTPEDKENALTHVPIQYRSVELYIEPNERGWETRYYKALFHTKSLSRMSPGGNLIQSVCMNYLEGLEWTFRYYTAGCFNWRWNYHYDYPPLLVDLYKYVPNNNHTQLLANDDIGYTSQEQLLYVLPVHAQQIEGIVDGNITMMPTQSEKTSLCKYQWAFCKYLWESHITVMEG